MPTPGANPSSTARWERTPDIGAAFTGLSRGGQRGRGGSRGGPRGGRGGPPRPPSTRDAKPEPDSRSDKPPSSQGKPKPLPPNLKPTPASAEPNDKPSNTPRAIPRSRRGSRAMPPPISTQVSTSKTSEPPTPASASRSSNRRRRSHAGRGSNPKPKLNGTEDDVVGSGQPRLSSTAPIKDTPPHLSNSRISNSNPAEIRTNIDALVERVRAVAMADNNRPSTPGSHIDWAGDDDDSLPDLDDWGITTASQSSLPAQTISPIIVGGLKPLPDPIAKVPDQPEEKGKSHTPLQERSHPISGTESKPREAEATAKDAILPEPPSESGTGTPSIKVSQSETPRGEPESKSASPSQASESSTVANSIHAPASAHDPLFGDIGNKDGIYASIHAPKGISDSTSAPPNLSTYPSLPKPPYNPNSNDNSLHGPSRRGGRPFSYHSQNRGPRGGGFVNTNNHSRNHSSPAMGGRHQHASRPVITGDAISRLARTIVATTPKSTSAISASDS